MPRGDPFSPRSPGESRVFSVDFGPDLDPGDFLTEVVASVLTVSQGQDDEASALLIGSPKILPTGDPPRVAAAAAANNPNLLMTVVAQQIGANAEAPAGFVARTTYDWRIAAVSNGGEKLIQTHAISVGAE